MKKFLTIVFAFILTATVFAETYKVKEVYGKVMFEDGTRIFEGQELEGEASIKVFPQSHIILVQDGKIRKINASQNGTVNELYAKAFKSNGLKKMKIADASHIAPPSEGTRKGVATAASRASEAKEDFEWDE